MVCEFLMSLGKETVLSVRWAAAVAWVCYQMLSKGV